MAVLPEGSKRLSSQHGHNEWWFTPVSWAQDSLMGKTTLWDYTEEKGLSFREIVGFEADDPNQEVALEYVRNQLRGFTENPFQPYQLQRIVADRDITPREFNPERRRE